MIQAMIFDLDGMLVQTERLKAISYAQSAVELCPDALTEAQVIEAFKEVVGLSRQEVAVALMERFSLADARPGAYGRIWSKHTPAGVRAGAAAHLRGDAGRPGGSCAAINGRTTSPCCMRLGEAAAGQAWPRSGTGQARPGNLSLGFM